MGNVLVWAALQGDDWGSYGGSEPFKEGSFGYTPRLCLAVQRIWA